MTEDNKPTPSVLGTAAMLLREFVVPTPMTRYSDLARNDQLRAAATQLEALEAVLANQPHAPWRDKDNCPWRTPYPMERTRYEEELDEWAKSLRSLRGSSPTSETTEDMTNG